MPQDKVNAGTRWKPHEMAKYYDFPTDATGANQKIGIIDFAQSLGNLADLKANFNALGAIPPEINVVDVSYVGQKIIDTGDQLEIHADVEIVGCICPQAQINVYRLPNNFAALATGIRQAVQDGVGVISISWVTPTGTWSSDGADYKYVIQATEGALVEARAANITVCVGAGDLGAWAQKGDGQAHTNYPSSSQLVLCCGGTEIEMDKGVAKEVVWNDGKRATGGGVSRFPKPAWQAGIDIKSDNPHNSSEGRVIPDVAGLASSVWQIAENGKVEGFGGTSAVGPLWAAFITLVNEKRSKVGKSRLGYLNPKLYALANKAALFNDITKGNNRKKAPGSPGYDAGVGYDACTGWGTPKGQALANALVALP